MQMWRTREWLVTKNKIMVDSKINIGIWDERDSFWDSAPSADGGDDGNDR
jgi:hypothetical protein